jgi:hypothetical protein
MQSTMRGDERGLTRTVDADPVDSVIPPRLVGDSGSAPRRN